MRRPLKASSGGIPLLSLGAISLAALLLVGCAAPQAPAPAQTSGASALPAAQSAPPPASPLSYGAVTSRVEKGKTTQAELIELFGGPNISTMDADGVETWVYERSSSETDAASESQRMSGGVGLDLFFNLGNFGAGASASGEAGRSSSRTKTTHSIKTLTVIVKFNKDKTVKDYSARAAYF